jgi:hypothetical protein
VSPVERDPVFGRGGPAVLPAQQRRRLRRWAVEGPRFDAVALAHELDPHEPLRTALLAQLDGRPRTCDDATARALADTRLDLVVFGIVAPPWPEHGAPALWYRLSAWGW